MIAVSLAGLATRLGLAAIFFNSSSAKAFALDSVAESLDRKIGWGKRPATVLAQAIVTAETGVGIAILLPPISTMGVLAAEALLLCFSIVTYLISGFREVAEAGAARLGRRRPGR